MTETNGQFNDVRIMDGAGVYATIRDLAAGDALNVALVDGDGNQITSFGGTSMTDDAAFTAGSSSVVPVGGVVTADSVDSGDTGAFAMLANRQQKVTLYDSGGIELAVGGGTQYTEGDTDASITGTAMLMEVAADALAPVQGTVAAGLLVNLGANNDVTVTGTVTAELSATDNAVLDNIDADLTTIIGHVDGVEGLLTTIDADTGGILTSVQLLDNIVYAEDSAHTTGESGAFVLAIRNANRTTLSGAELDYSGLAVDASGRVIITGQTAHDSATGDVPVIVGGYASAAAPADVSADADAVRAWYLRNGAQAVNLTAAGALIPGSAADGLTVNLGTNNDVTVTGTVDLGATDNAVLDNIDADLTTIISHLDGVEGLLTTIDADTGGILTSVQTIDDAVFADDAAFTLTSSKAMVSGAIRDDSLAALTAVEGDVVPLRVSSTGALHVTGGGGGTEYTVDDAAPAAPTGATFVMERDDQLAALTEVEGDWTNPRATSKGALWVALADSSGDPITSFGGGTQYTEDDAAAANPVGTAMIMVRDDALSGQTTTDGDNVAARGTDKGELYVKHVDSIAVTGTVDLGATDNAVLDNIDADLTTIIGHVDGIEGLLTTIDGDTGNIVTSVQLLDDVVFADDAAFTLATSKVAMAGAIRDDALSALTAVEGDAVPLRVDANGGLWVTPSGTVTVTASNLDVQSGGADLATTTQAGAIQTSVELIDDTVKVLGTDTYAEATSKGIVMGAVRRDADTTLANTTNEFTPLQVDANGYLKVEIFDGGGSHTVDNNGTFAVQVDGSALTALQLIDNPVLVDDAAFTPATSSVMMAGFQADEASTDSVDEGDAGAARMTLDRKQIVTTQPHTAGGHTIFRSIDIDESEEEVKATAGQLYTIVAFNRTAAPLYLKFYNLTAANTTVGTSTPVLTFVVPANADSDGAGFVWSGVHGWPFDTAISVACTTGVADADTGAPGANDCIINLGYM